MCLCLVQIQISATALHASSLELRWRGFRCLLLDSSTPRLTHLPANHHVELTCRSTITSMPVAISKAQLKNRYFEFLSFSLISQPIHRVCKSNFCIFFFLSTGSENSVRQSTVAGLCACLVRGHGRLDSAQRSAWLTCSYQPAQGYGAAHDAWRSSARTSSWPSSGSSHLCNCPCIVSYCFQR
jgi:hypothetical protein